MNENLQLILSNYEVKYSDLSVYLNNDESEFYIYIGIALLECISLNAEEIGHKMFIGRLYNAGVKLSLLRDRFNHDGRTVKKWGAALKSCNIEEITLAFTGRKGHKKVIPEVIRYIIQQYNNKSILGRSYRKKIIQGVAEVFSITLSPSMVSTIFKNNRMIETDISSLETGEKEDIPEQLNNDLSSKNESSVYHSPIFQVDKFSSLRGEMIHNAGLVLFEKYLCLYANFPKQIISQILLGAINIEQSKSLCFESLLRFNDEVEKVLNTQRDLLDEYASKENEIELYKQNAELLSDGPNKGTVYYFDPHTKHYTGMLKILKGWCGSLHSVSKVINLDAFHTESGRPCFIQHYTPYYDMRERFFMSLELFDHLFEPDKRFGRTFIIDRGIYGKECFKRFEKDYLITWEKGYDGTGWDEDKPSIEFTKYRVKNSKNSKKKEYHFECQEHEWDTLNSFRKIIVKATNNNNNKITVSVLCSNPEMDVTTIVWLIFNRWLQENDFKYLNTHFGINQLDSRSRFKFENISEKLTDREVDCIEYKNAKKETKSHENKLAKKLLSKNRNAKNIDIKKNEIKKIEVAKMVVSKKAQTGLNKELSEAKRRLIKLKDDKIKIKNEQIMIEENLENAEENQASILRKSSHIQELINANYDVIDTRRKAYIDALRINSANVFRNIADEFRAVYDNYRDDHFYLRLLSRSSGLISTNNKNELNIKLWLPGSLQKYIIDKMSLFINDITTQLNSRKFKLRNVKIELINGTFLS